MTLKSSETKNKNAAAMREAQANKLTARQRKFAMNVHRGMTDYEAAVRAGYTAGHQAKSRALELRNDTRVQLLLDQLSKGDVIEPDKLNPQFIITRLLDIAGICAKRGKYMPALRALELLGKHLAMFVERSETELILSENIAEQIAKARARVASQNDALNRRQLPKGDVVN